jgi:hypothetical protein
MSEPMMAATTSRSEIEKASRPGHMPKRRKIAPRSGADQSDAETRPATEPFPFSRHDRSGERAGYCTDNDPNNDLGQGNGHVPPPYA